MLYPLEERFQRPVSLPDHIDGIILLGGYMNGTINAARGGTEMNSAADRLVETMRLAKHYKNTQIIVTGGEGTYFDRSTPDAVSTAELFDIFGVDDGRVIYESQSRNTIENASFSYELLRPQKSQRWLLVTSAFHMPRSVGVFRQAGFEVIAWPVDYKTVPDTSFSFYFQNPNQAFARSSTAIHEWLGLLAYWWSGETKEIFPQP
ncbi:YdcF family protein [Brucellaceae bacterium C25G]